MLLLALAQASQRVRDTSGRLEKIGTLAEAIRGMSPTEIPIGIAFLTGELTQGKIGIGPRVVHGMQRPAPASEASLSLAAVDTTFAEIAAMRGTGSQGRRLAHLQTMMGQATATEQEFLVRLMGGALRQGAMEGVVVEAIAKAAEVPAAEVRRAQMLAANLGAVAVAAMTERTPGLRRFTIELFRPLLPMLAHPANDVDEALQHLGEMSLEYKLDGARVQVHKDGDRVEVYSRRQNLVTHAVPELVESVAALPVRRLILDGETIALRSDGRPLPFQVTMRRFGRKLDVEQMRAKLPLTTMFFDCLLVDEQSIVDSPTHARWDALVASLPPALRIPRLRTASAEAAATFVDQALDAGHEGAMAKAIDAPYEAGRRGKGWLKLKPAHTLDLVVLAAEWGSGRRKGWLSNLHLGARDPQSGGFVMLGKTFKGMTDAVLTWQTERLQQLEIGRDAYTVHVRPELVVEIAFNDVQRSPQYPGGLALRFARLKRYRNDKGPEQADTIATVRELVPPQD